LSFLHSSVAQLVEQLTVKMSFLIADQL